MSLPRIFNRNHDDSADTCRQVKKECRNLRAAATRGELGRNIAVLALRYSPQDIRRMQWNFETKVRDLPPDYRDQLKKCITGHLLGTFQRIRLDDQQGSFKTLHQKVTEHQKTYWDMVAGQCSDDGGGDNQAIRFLKYLLAGYCMIVLGEPGHPVGTPFPGGDEVEITDGIWYCPVREKAGDVDAALCPFCPARQTPEVGYLRPATRPTGRSRQEYIDNCHRFHNFNG